MSTGNKINLDCMLEVYSNMALPEVLIPYSVDSIYWWETLGKWIHKRYDCCNRNFGVLSKK